MAQVAAHMATPGPNPQSNQHVQSLEQLSTKQFIQSLNGLLQQVYPGTNVKTFIPESAFSFGSKVSLSLIAETIRILPIRLSGDTSKS